MAQALKLATRKGLFKYEQQASGSWEITESAFLGDAVTNVFTDPRDGTQYASLNLGHFGVKLHRADKGTWDWQEVNTPKYPKQDEEDAPSLNLLWEMAAGHNNSLLAGTIPGGLFRSYDRGDTWELIPSLWECPEREKWMGGGYDHPGIHTILVDPRDTKRVFIAISCGGVWESRDDCQTWENVGDGLRAAYMPEEQAGVKPIQDPHRVQRSAKNPDIMWMQHHNGIFRSEDSGRTWTEPESPYSTFGFAVAVHPNEPDTAWFVPAEKDEKRIPVDGKFITTRTRDGGKTWEVVDKGLPEGLAYDLVYRHSLVIDDTGGHLFMGTTTGNLWHCHKDQWQLLNAHLPMIHALAFDPA